MNQPQPVSIHKKHQAGDVDFPIFCLFGMARTKWIKLDKSLSEQIKAIQWD
jgi:hypothetical protein